MNKFLVVFVLIGLLSVNVLAISPWVKIASEGWFTTYRMLVPGGWLVKIECDMVSKPSSTITFLPDPKHVWN